MKIAIGADHAGFSLKEKLKKYLQQKGVEVKDFGPASEASVDYPDFAHPVANAVEKKEVDLGGLRKVLEASLKNESKKKDIFVDETRDGVWQRNKKSGIIKPGESIKFD